MRFSGWREGWTNPFFAFFPAARWQMFTEEGSLCAEVVDNMQLRQNSTAPLHNGPAVNKDGPVFKIFHVFQVVATGAYYPKLELESHKNQYFSWLLRSEHVKTNIFGNRMTKLTI